MNMPPRILIDNPGMEPEEAQRLAELLPLEQGNHVEQEPTIDGTALVKAVQGGEINKVRELLAEGLPTTVDSVGLTPLMIAARNGHTDIARHLIEAGADVNLLATLSAGSMRVSALWFSSAYGRPEVVKLLLDAGADPNDWCGEESNKLSPLKAACEEGSRVKYKHKKKFKRYAEIIQLLLAAGAK